MRVPTVTVKHSSGDGFIIINVSDLRDHHEIASREHQAPDFDFESLALPVKRLDPALRDYAANLMLSMMSFRMQVEGEPFDELDDVGKLEQLRKMSTELDDSKLRYSEDQAERLAYEASQSAQTQAEQPTSQGTPSGHDAVQGGQTGSTDESQSGQESGQTQTGDAKPAEPQLSIEAYRGRYYIWRGDQKVSKGFQDLEEARAERDRLIAEESAQ